MVNKIVKACRSAWVERSFKREMAALALVFYCVTLHRHLSVTDPALVTAQSGSIQTLTMFLLPIIAAAYGVDAWFKQGPKT
jgi:hypothetical protein